MTLPLTRAHLVQERFQAQHLTSAPLTSPEEVVGKLLAVQSQDLPLGAWSVGLRMLPRTEGAVMAALAAGSILRTHVLRPTWHFVSAEDLPWLLQLTGAKVERAVASHLRAAGIDGAKLAAGFSALEELLGEGAHLTRAAVGPELAARGIVEPGIATGHLLFAAEQRGLVVSGAPQGRVHTYAWGPHRFPAAKPASREELLRRLVARLLAGHGPISLKDVQRWVLVTKTELRGAVAELGAQVEEIEVDGVRLYRWAQPPPPPVPNPRRAFLLQTFDEAALSFSEAGLPRPATHPRGNTPLNPAEAGGGLVVLDGRDVGYWKRTLRGEQMLVRLHLAAGLGPPARTLVAQAAAELADFAGAKLLLDEFEVA